MERAVALARAPWLGPETLFASEAPGWIALEPLPATLAEARALAERQHIRAALDRAGGRIDDAAKSLGISRSTLFDKMKKLDVRSEL